MYVTTLIWTVIPGFLPSLVVGKNEIKLFTPKSSFISDLFLGSGAEHKVGLYFGDMEYKSAS